MKVKKEIYPIFLILFMGLFVSCDAPTADNGAKQDTKFVIFQNTAKGETDQRINALLEKNVLQEAQINFRYKHKISGFSANLGPSQATRFKNTDYKGPKIIPGEFIITFIDPFDGEKYGTEEANTWSMKKIKEIQAKYNISDKEVLSRYGYAIFGFAAKLNDKQLYELDHEELVNRIEPNVLFYVD